MKRKVIIFMTVLTLSMSLSACGKNDSFPQETGSNSDTTQIEELEQRIEELEAENEELKAPSENLDSTENNQQSVSEADSLLQSTIASPETSGVCGANLTWFYQNGVLAITGTGEMTDYSNGGKDTPWYDLKDKIGWVIIDEGITTVGENAFYKSGTLSKVELPNTLTSIGYSAFCGCENLTVIYNGQAYKEEEFIDLAKELNIGDSSMFGWYAEAPAEAPAE